jgi:CRISPR/Cas system-associated protein Cas7 (RAMP superfamily)
MKKTFREFLNENSFDISFVNKSDKKEVAKESNAIEKIIYDINPNLEIDYFPNKMGISISYPVSGKLKGDALKALDAIKKYQKTL